MKKIALLGLFILILSGVEARLFDFNSVEPPFFGCSITGCVMQGDIDMNGYIIYNVTFVNATFHEFDPVFVAENSSIWNAINSKLNETDQRYNDTLLIGIVNTSIYISLNDETNARIDNDTYLQGQINYLELNKLNITDQRYNDTLLILDVNDSIYITLADYYTKNESDGLYYPLSNPAGYINATALSNITNGTWVEVAGDTMTGDLNMSNNSILDVNVLSVHNITGRSPILISSPVISVENITATNFYGNINGVNGTIFGMTITNGTIENMHVSESAIFNTSLLPELNDTWSLGNENFSWKNFYVANLYAKNISAPNVNQYYADEVWIYREQYGNTTDYIFYFNETLLNISINQSLQTIYGLLGYLNESLYNETLARISNDSYLQGQIKQPTGPYLANDSTTFWINESALNYTINNISKVHVIIYNMTCTASLGTCNVTSTNISYQITEVKVTPATLTNKYKFELTEYPITNIIDKDRARHEGVWDIEKNYAVSGAVRANITNTDIDELFTISIIYLTNGVE